MTTNKQTRKLKNTLMFAFMSLSIIPLTVFAFIFLLSQSQELTEQSKQKLTSMRNNQTLQVQDYFHRHSDIVRQFSRSELAISSGGRFYGFPAAFEHLGNTKEDAQKVAKMRYILGSGDIKSKRTAKENNKIGSERYRLIHKRYHHHFTDILESSDFSDILIVDLSGVVVYSTLKNAEYGADLLSKALDGSQLTNAFLQISKLTNEATKKEIPVYFSDFDNISHHQASESWFAAPIKENGYLHSFAIFKLSNAPLTKMLKESNEHEIKTLITNDDAISRLTPDQGDKLSISNISILEGIKGFTSVSSFSTEHSEKVLAAYSPITVQGKAWIISVELPESTAYAPIYQLEEAFLLTLLFALITISIVAHYLSNYIVAPVLGLAWMAERVTEGDLNLDINETKRKDEIGRLAVSFVKMKNSVRDKLTLINEQNQKLENNLNLIQQQNDELLKTDKLKDEFLATTSQELRTPLHGMLGVTETLRSGAYGNLTTEQQFQLEIINNSGHRLAHLVDDLLDYHRAYYGNLPVNKNIVDLSSAVNLVLKLSEHLLENKQLRVINQIPDDLPLVFADEQRIEQVLYNLIGNAIKYTTDGKVLICSTIIDKIVQIQVIDTGNGIDEFQLAEIFKPLSKVKIDSPYYRQSAGLGLAISKKLIKLMGGDLTVSSQPNIGTTFTFTLPIAEHSEHNDKNNSDCNDIEKTHYQPPIPYQQIKINPHYLPTSPNAPLLIIADDEAINLQVLESFLQLDGYRIKTAKNGQEALALLKEEQPDLILLDVMMPGMSGYEVCKKIRMKFTLDELPIIMLTALNQGKDRMRGFESGANDYVSKPFNQKEISARITAQLQATKTLQFSNKNKQLIQSLDQQLIVESTLLETQLHLLKLLDNNSDAILCIRNDEKILYANHNAGKLFKHTPNQLQHFRLEDIVVKRSLVDSKLTNNALDIYIDGKISNVTASVIRLPEQSGWHSLIVFCTDNNYDMQRINNLETAVEVLSAYSLDGNISQLQTLKELGGEFTRLAEKVEGKSTDQKHIKRELVVNIMTQLLTYWEKESGKTKFQLAEDSQIWRVYLDRSTLQTRTLDKYLHIETLPKAPRWRNVLNTIEYVFKHCDAETKQRDAIAKLRLQLQKLLS